MPTRRQFVAGAGSTALAGLIVPNGIAAGLSAARRAPLLRGVHFDQGVMSGDPTPHGITLLTHAGGVGGTGSVNVEVARDKHFAHVVAHGPVRTSESLGHMAKIKIKGLHPGHEYFFRFDSKGGHSQVGRFRTAPAPGSHEKIRFAMVSCQEFTWGYFNAHALLAKEKDLDFVLQLGDYIYADVRFPDPPGVRTDPNPTAVTLQQFRDKYATYRSDKHLQAAQANHAWINLWDDHEVQDNYVGGDPAGGETSSPFNPAAKANGYTAFFEQQPTTTYGRGTRLYHHAGFGGLLDLFVLDERQYRSRQPCGKADLPSCPDASDPSLKFLGAQQEAFVQSGLANSRARWKVVANEVQIMRRLEADGTSGIDDRDAWGGYLHEREALLRVARDVPGTVFCTGDIHEFIAGTARLADGTPAAPEICGSAITSLNSADLGALQGKPGYGTTSHPSVPAAVTAGRLAHNPEWKYLDEVHKGYVICEVSRDQFKATLKKVATIKSPSTKQAPHTLVSIRHGSPSISVS